MTIVTAQVDTYDEVKCSIEAVFYIERILKVLLSLAMCVWLLLQHRNNSQKSNIKIDPGGFFDSSLTALTMKTNRN